MTGDVKVTVGELSERQMEAYIAGIRHLARLQENCAEKATTAERRMSLRKKAHKNRQRAFELMRYEAPEYL